MSKPRILIEITENGITETGVIAATDGESTAAYRFLAAIAAQLRSLSAASKIHGHELISK